MLTINRGSILNELLNNLLSEIPDILAALVFDLDGLVIAKQSVKSFDGEVIGAITCIVDQAINKIKRFAETTLGSGIFDTNEYRLFYIELGCATPSLFVIIFDPYASVDSFIPYSYIVAEKISSILSDTDTSLDLPELTRNNELVIKSENLGFLNKIIIIGQEEVGKSTLVEQYFKGKFRENYRPTIGVSIMTKNFQITKEINITISIFDLGGSKNFAKVRKFYYTESKAIIIVFDYSRLETFDRVYEWIEEAQQFIKNPNVPYFLVGNKIDLNEHRDLIRDRALDFALKHDITFYETSALTGEGVDELFTHLASNLL